MPNVNIFNLEYSIFMRSHSLKAQKLPCGSLCVLNVIAIYFRITGKLVLLLPTVIRMK